MDFFYFYFFLNILPSDPAVAMVIQDGKRGEKVLAFGKTVNLLIKMGLFFTSDLNVRTQQVPGNYI